MPIVESWIARMETLTGAPRSVLVATAVLAAGWMLALLARFAVGRIVQRLTKSRHDRDGEEGLAAAIQRHRTDRIFAKATYWFVLLLTVMAATELLGLPVVTSWLGAAATYLPRVFVAFLVGLAGIVFGSLGRQAITRALPASDVLAPERVGRLAQIAIVGVSFLVALQQLGIDLGFVTTMVAIALMGLLGAGALAFGLGGRETVANILGAHYARDLYQPGQTIRVGELEGQIVRVTATTVVLETKGGQAAIPGSVFSRASTMRVAHGE